MFIGGKKLWILAIPREVDGRDAFAKMDIFLGRGFDLESPSSKQWRLEGIVLPERTRLFAIV
jgi:hypothetical protein